MPIVTSPPSTKHDNRVTVTAPRLQRPAVFWTFIRYNLVGLLNTGLGYGLIFGLMFFFNLSPNWSNFIGYAIGALVSYYLNRSFTFRSKRASLRQSVLFFSVVAVSYLLNLLVLDLLLPLGGGRAYWKYVSQFVAGIVYIFVSFVLLKVWVFREAPGTGSD